MYVETLALSWSKSDHSYDRKSDSNQNIPTSVPSSDMAVEAWSFVSHKVNGLICLPPACGAGVSRRWQVHVAQRGRKKGLTGGHAEENWSSTPTMHSYLSHWDTALPLFP